MSKYGFVYVLTNECMPGVAKIGYTDRSPLQRVEELSGSTSIPVEFEIYCYGETCDAFEFEQGLHKWMGGSRINPRREFFNLSVPQLMLVADRIEEECVHFVEGWVLNAHRGIDHFVADCEALKASSLNSNVLPITYKGAA